MKIGLLTHYNVNNQGAQLQMLSMKSILEELGHEVYILTYNKDFSFDLNEKKKNSASFIQFPYYLKEYLFKKGFGLTLFNTRKALKNREFLKTYSFKPYDTNEIDCVIIGSDEVFSIDVGFNKMMYGAGLKKPAIAYAPSFGRSTLELLKEYNVYETIKDGLSNMYKLSSRDMHTKEMIKSLINKVVPIVCDPVILYDGKSFESNIRLIEKPYMLIYSYDRNMTDSSEIKEIEDYARKHNLLTVSCGTYHSWCDKNIACNAKEWYSYFKYAQVVLTDTFHGTVVAMKNNCNLAVYVRESINGFKLESLLNETNLNDRRLVSITEDNMELVYNKQIDYKDVENRLNLMIQNSKKYLLESLEGIK